LRQDYRIALVGRDAARLKFGWHAGLALALGWRSAGARLELGWRSAGARLALGWRAAATATCNRQRRRGQRAAGILRAAVRDLVAAGAAAAAAAAVAAGAATIRCPRLFIKNF